MPHRFEVYSEEFYKDPRFRRVSAPKNVLIWSGDSYAEAIKAAKSVKEGFLRNLSSPNVMEHEIIDGELYDY